METLYLKQEWGELALWPTDSGRFNFTQVEDGASFEVMGDVLPNVPTGSGLSYNPSPTFGNATASVPKRPFARKSASSSTSTFACKIIMAGEMQKNGKATTFTEQGQTYINLNDDTANVNFIKEQLREKTGRKLLMVAGNGLPIPDEEGTRGKEGNMNIYPGRCPKTKRNLCFIRTLENERNLQQIKQFNN